MTADHAFEKMQSLFKRFFKEQKIFCEQDDDISGFFLDLVSYNEKVAKPVRPWWFLDVLSGSLMTKWPLA
ncbi:hypothetical protein CEXT_39051 [Caerostris extrusa]|uniref:Uncharacterized protein n=1 Tax=Caerostris extrusa TaxID=172846 RepID=A0AAV4TFY3_CAEEX|nr:hypothetical protein CEXT_39051 [Caerostris extrusa]